MILVRGFSLFRAADKRHVVVYRNRARRSVDLLPVPDLLGYHRIHQTPSQLTSSNGLWFAVGLDQIPDAIAIGVVMGCILTIPQYSIFHALHLINTMLAIIIPCCVSPFGFFLGRVYAQTSMPNELLEHSGRFWPVSGRISPLTGRIGC